MWTLRFLYWVAIICCGVSPYDIIESEVEEADAQ